MRRLALLLLLLLWPLPAAAHMQEFPELDSWMSELTSSFGGCCGFAEATKLDENDWYFFGSGYMVRVHGSWIVVAEQAIIRGEANPFGQVVIWPFQTTQGWSIRCLLPVSGS